MEEIEKYEAVNKASTTQELKDAITKIGNVQGSKLEWSPDHMIDAIDRIKLNPVYPVFNLLTRSYGIRQQMIYLMTYKKD